MSVSVCYIIKDEGLTLEASLLSVKSIADEIIVVDTGSTDESVKIASRHGSRVEKFSWVDDFSAARNFAASFARSDWILFVDGDEILEVDGATKIRAAIESDPSVYAFGVLQRNYTNDRSYPHWKPVDTKDSGEVSALAKGLAGFSDNLMMKLYRNHCGILWEGFVHETVVGSCRRLGLLHKEIPICILHHLNELKSEAFRAEKKNYYLKLSIEKLKQNPEHENPWFEVGISMTDTGHFAEAERAFKEALLRRPSWGEAKLFRGRVLLQLDRNAEAEILFRELLGDPAFQNEAYGHLSTALLYQGKLSECEECILAAMKSGSKHLALYVNAGVLYFEKKDFEKSRTHLEAAFKINPNDPFLKSALERTNSVLKVN